jgi:hypothetical protein
MDDATMLAELEPTAEILVDRHLGMAKEWFPHDLVEWRPPIDSRRPPSLCPRAWPAPCSSTS